MWLIATSICSIVVLIFATMLCLCWKKKTEKNDLLGLDGLVTQKNPDENVNHLPSAIVQSVPDGPVNAADDTEIEFNKRPIVVNNPRRSLPDIPLDGIRTEGDVTYEPNGDNTSDLYATVEPYQNLAKRHTLPNGLDSRPSISQHSSLSQADDTFSPYARLNEHPYDKVKKTEHSYARVHKTNDQELEENSSGEATPRTVALRNVRTSTLQTLSEGAAGSRSQRSSSHSTVESDIPAASAVAGGIAANQELPYMTPPITQPNFSGDSQDSSRGYTSISVREPLANIRAQTKIMSKLQGDVDPHYSTVSDDSDDMYTTIQDPNNQVYTSGSETYAQIQPPQLTVAVEINAEPTGAPLQGETSKTEEKYRAPQPPSVDSLKHVSHSHSRQGSSSSSVGNIGSPKPEKRQANSPLPPPPPTTSSPGSDTPSSSKNLDEMYAKVQKGRKKSDDHEEKSTKCKQNTNKTKTDKTFTDHNYETLKKQKCTDPGYEQLKVGDEVSEPGYDTINGPPSILSSDPGYEVLQHDSNRLTVENNGYSIVNKSKSNSSSDEIKSKNSSTYESRDLSLDEPNYESMPSESFSDHNYALLKSESESDPNYESVNHSDPNYESVKYLDVSLEEEPPYERLHEDESSKNDSVTSSEKVSNKSNVSSSKALLEPDEKLNVDPGYETIRSESYSKDNGSVHNVQFESDYDGIVQV